MATSEQQKAAALAEAACLAGREDEAFRRALSRLWEMAFEQGPARRAR
jgi:hypothetical protein